MYVHTLCPLYSRALKVVILNQVRIQRLPHPLVILLVSDPSVLCMFAQEGRRKERERAKDGAMRYSFQHSYHDETFEMSHGRPCLLFCVQIIQGGQ